MIIFLIASLSVFMLSSVFLIEFYSCTQFVCHSSLTARAAEAAARTQQQQHNAQRSRRMTEQDVNSASTPAHAVGKQRTFLTGKEVRIEKFGGNGYHVRSDDIQAVLGTRHAGIKRMFSACVLPVGTVSDTAGDT